MSLKKVQHQAGNAQVPPLRWAATGKPLKYKGHETNPGLVKGLVSFHSTIRMPGASSGNTSLMGWFFQVGKEVLHSQHIVSRPHSGLSTNKCQHDRRTSRYMEHGTIQVKEDMAIIVGSGKQSCMYAFVHLGLYLALCSTITSSRLPTGCRRANLD